MSYIPTHLIDAQDRLLEQYKNQPKIQALLASILGPIQEIEDGLNALDTGRGVSGAVGVQLDRLGNLVGISRGRLSDDVYRTRIRIKIIQNLSEGEPERLIQVYGALVGGTSVQIQEHFPGGVGLSSNGPIPVGQETLIYQNVQTIAAAGVRVDYIETFPAVSPFVFLGGPLQSGGFADLNNSSEGGGMGEIHVPVGIKFAFGGGAPGAEGFGDLRDPVMGGHLVSI